VPVTAKQLSQRGDAGLDNRRHCRKIGLADFEVNDGAALRLQRAGLLDGRKASTYWAARDRLRSLGVEVVEERFVRDGNVITAGGVSAGIDMALYLVGLLKGPEVARNVQKAIEYYPEPPFADEAALSAGKETA